MKPIIQVQNLSKTFKYYKKQEGLLGSIKALGRREKLYKKAVNDVSFSINKGEIVGFVGSNGAGKTTTLKMLTGILYPTSGEISIMGFNPSNREDAYKKRIAFVMGQKSQLWKTIPAVESFNLIAKIYEIPEKTYRKRLKKLSTMLKVDDVLQVQVRKLSLGQRMKCEIIASLLHKPDVIFLDEPTIGLDVTSQKTVRHFIKEYNRKYGLTVILTSHYMADVEELCERLIVINEGVIGYDGKIKELIDNYKDYRVVKVVFENKVTVSKLSPLGKVRKISPYEMEIDILESDFRKNMGLLVTKFPVQDISIKDVNLEEIIEDFF